MGPIEALKLALSKEIEAIELYRRLSRDYPVARETFLYLSGEEEKHKRVLEEKIYELSK